MTGAGSTTDAQARQSGLRRLASGGLTAGGLLGVLAFFLPWVAVSCDGAPLGRISPYDRAVGVQLAGDAPILLTGLSESPDQDPSVEAMGPAPTYFSLLLGAGIAVALGGLLAAGRSIPLRGVALAGFVVGLGNLAAAVTLGLVQRLGLTAFETTAAGMQLKAETGVGVWVAVIGAALTALTGLSAALFAREGPGRRER